MKIVRMIACCVLASLAPLGGMSQKLVSEKGTVSFFSDATLEDIDAVNKKVTSILNLGTGDIVFAVPIKEFHFDKSLMEEHFNEKYMHSDQYPKSTFQGKVSGIDPASKEVQKVKAIGKLTIHGVTRDVEIPGTLENTGDKWLLKSKFPVKLEDYKVEIPKLLWEKIAESVEVTVDLSYKQG